MASKLFLDANIILEYYLDRSNKNEVRELFLLNEQNRVRLFTTLSIIQTCGYFLLKKYGDKAVREIIKETLNFVTLIDCLPETIILALDSNISDMEDAIHYHCAIENKLDYYLTFDKKLISEATILLPIYSPKQFLNL